jgi:hypothetical protein
MAEIIKRRNTPKKSIRLVSLIIIFILFCILLITHVIFWFNDTLVNEIWVDYSNRANPVTGFNAGYYSSIGDATCGEIFEVSLRGSDYGYDYSGYVGDGFTLALSTNQGRKNIEEFKVSSSNEDVVEFDGEKFILKSSGTATIKIKKHFTKLEYTVQVLGADKISVSVPRSATEIVKGEKTLVGVDFPSYYSYHDAEKMFDFKISPSASATLTIEKMRENTFSVYVTAQAVGEFYLDMYYEDERIASAEFTVTDK